MTGTSMLRSLQLLLLALLAASTLSACQCTASSTSCGGPDDCADARKPYCATALLTCVECLEDAHCPVGAVCNPDGVCEAGCRSEQDRCELGKVCRPGHGCVECTLDTQCGPGRVCGVNNTCVAGCSAANQACPLGLVCDLSVGRCVACVRHSDCRNPAVPFCEPTSNRCVECLTGVDCRDPARPVCDPSTNSCVRCVLDSQCPAGNVCTNNACVPGCSANQACPAGQVCSGAGQCVQCLNDTHCGGATPRCDTQSSRCVACLPGATDNCPVGQYCRNDFVCERGCKAGADCPSGVCLPNHSCGGCTADSQCAAGNVCSNGTCIAACSATAPCGAGKECCNGRCEDLVNDNANCGACGRTCGGGAACCNGACQPLDTVTHCGACGRSCASGQGCCAGTCTPLNTLTNCGVCGTACGVDQFCDSSLCRDISFPEFCANRRVYAIQDGQPLDNAATTVLASTVTQYCSSQTNVTTGPQTNAAWVDQATGALLLGGGATVVTAGGPVPNLPVRWLERTRTVTKVYFASNNIDTFYFRRRSDGVNVVSRAANLCSSHSDVFLVELVADPTSSTLALIAYGMCGGGYGTQTGAWYWANVMLPNRASYPDSWYIYEWADTNNDSLPNAGDTFTRLASGQ